MIFENKTFTSKNSLSEIQDCASRLLRQLKKESTKYSLTFFLPARTHLEKIISFVNSTQIDNNVRRARLQKEVVSLRKLFDRHGKQKPVCLHILHELLS